MIKTTSKKNYIDSADNSFHFQFPVTGRKQIINAPVRHDYIRTADQSSSRPGPCFSQHYQRYQLPHQTSAYCVSSESTSENRINYLHLPQTKMHFQRTVSSDSRPKPEQNRSSGSGGRTRNLNMDQGIRISEITCNEWKERGKG